MTTQRLGLIMNGVTGRMGLNQHLIRSIVAIRERGGVRLKNGDRVMPDPILVGRSAEKVEGLARLRAERDGSAVRTALGRLEAAARDGSSIVPPTIDAVRAYATVGEISETLRGVFGSYEPDTVI